MCATTDPPHNRKVNSKDMHMSDALLSAPVAIAADVAAATLLAVASTRLKKESDSGLIPLMGVAGAFIFAAQMLNFSIPGTGSSGHIIGGVLLAALLGPWAGFLTLASVIIIQCLVFADGGLMALGCNLINMGAMTTLVAYPMIFRPLLKFPAPAWKIMAVSVLACVVGLEGGALMVTLETALSGITALPTGDFLLLMTAIHLAIGICEGIATGVVLIFVGKSAPSLLNREQAHKLSGRKIRNIVIGFAAAALLFAGILAFFASSDPDGLEWSIMKLTGTPDLPATDTGSIAQGAAAVQTATSVMPDYGNSFSGIAGVCMVIILVWGLSGLLLKLRKSRQTA